MTDKQGERLVDALDRISGYLWFIAFFLAPLAAHCWWLLFQTGGAKP